MSIIHLNQNEIGTLLVAAIDRALAMDTQKRKNFNNIKRMMWPLVPAASEIHAIGKVLTSTGEVNIVIETRNK